MEAEIVTEKWELLEAIYGPEGLMYVKVQDREWYDRLDAEIEEEGDKSIWGRGYVLGVVRDYNGNPIVCHEVTGSEYALKHFTDLENDNAEG